MYFAVTMNNSLFNKLSLLLFCVLLPCFACAQKPIDRGIHKRKTGGIAVMLGNTFSPLRKAEEQGRPQNSSRELMTLETMAPKEISSFQTEERSLVALNLASNRRDFLDKAQKQVRPSLSIFRLEKKGAFALIQDPSLSRKRRLISTDQASPDEPADGFASAGMVMGILSIPLIAAPMVSFFGIVLSVIGLFRTRSGERKGRGMAVAGLICSSLSALLLYMFLSALPAWG